MKIENRAGAVIDLEAGRRAFLRNVGIFTAATALGSAAIGSASAQDAEAEAEAAKVTDVDILNFALNLEYLEAEYYLMGVFGRGLKDGQITGKEGPPGIVVGGKQVEFKTGYLRGFFQEIARDERAHVDFLRTALGSEKVARPKIDLKNSFNAAAKAAGLISGNQTFDPFLNEDNFLLGAFIFEDVGVTAYMGAAPLIKNKDYLSAAAGILAVEAYHAGEIRTNLYRGGFFSETAKISKLRDSADGGSNLDQPLKIDDGRANIVPADENSIAFSRTADQVLGVVYLGGAKKGGFFPGGVNGGIK